MSQNPLGVYVKEGQSISLRARVCVCVRVQNDC